MLTIKEVDITDLENLMSIWNNGEIMKFVGFPTGLHRTHEDAIEWLNKFQHLRPQLNRYAIYDSKIGFCGETDYTIRGDKCDLDIKLALVAQGKKIATKALSFTINQAFNAGVKAVHTSPYSNNERSIALYKKMGFSELKKEIIQNRTHKDEKLNKIFQAPSDTIIYMELKKENWIINNS